MLPGAITTIVFNRDDAWLRRGPGTLDSRLDRLDSLGVKTVRFTLGPEAFRMWDIDMSEVVEPGLFDILAGPNSQDVKSATLEIV